MKIQDIGVIESGLKPVITPTYLVNHPRSNAGDIHLKSVTEAPINAFNISCIMKID